MNKRIPAILFAVLAVGGSAAAQDVATPRDAALSPAPEIDAEGRTIVHLERSALPGARACSDAWRCPDPLLIDSQPVESAEYIRPPEIPYEPTYITDITTGERVEVRRAHQLRVGRGFTAPAGSAPWMAQLQRPAAMPQFTRRALDWEDRMQCGGALIAPGWIVTAAHCLTDMGADIKAAGYRVRLGVTDIRNAASGVTYRIAAVYPHPQYDPKRFFNDIALIRFATDEQTERGRRIWVQSIAVDTAPPTARRLGGAEAWFYGWGRTERDAPSAPLLYGRVKLQPDTGCERSLIALCGLGIGTTGSTQCHGDSGGPLVWWDENMPTLVGVVSHNLEKAACGRQQKPGVFTRIASFKRWIESLTGPLQSGKRRS